MILLKLLRDMVKALNSEGTPGQVAAGAALGACLGLTPLLNPHNLLVVLAAMMFNVSLAGFSMGWTVFLPVGFLLDPLFDRIGAALLSSEALQPLWTRLANTPVVALTNFDNSVVLGSVVFWLAAAVPIYLAAKPAIVRYRANVYERLRRTRFFQVVRASSLYRVYTWFNP